MNKNTIIGIVLIVVILVGFGIINSPSKKEKEKMMHIRDSIIKVDKAKKEQRKLDSINKLATQTTSKADTLKGKSIIKSDTSKVKGLAKTTNANVSDTSAEKQSKDAFGVFAGSLKGTKKFITIQNELAKFRFSTLGGRIYYAELKKYHTFDTLPLILMNGDSTLFNLIFSAHNRTINSSLLYFTPLFTESKFAGKDSVSIKGNDSLKFAMRLYPDSLKKNENKYIELLYTVYGNDYMMKIQLNFIGLQDIISENTTGVHLEWKQNLRQQEKSLKNERMASTIYYKYYGDEVDYLSESKPGNKDLATKVNWIGFKQQFFSTVLIADKGFSDAKIITNTNDSAIREVKTCLAKITIPFENNGKQSVNMRMYLGPNHYKTLKKYNLDLEHQIPLGWTSPYILGWINRFAVIPVFNWLQSYGINYGIIILILTILLKIVLFPIAYKTYMSSAKMRVLKPEIDEINKKFPKEKAMERQQATMALYKKAGVNPLAGCIPMLLQMPILIALYRFFPASIELRQQHFLWATDLSSYDSVWNFGFTIPFYGDHVSLFTLLMTVSTIFYTKLNNQLMGNQQQMPGMKFMMYFMPVMFLGFFNNFAAGLSYYYLLANLITFLQMWIIRRSVNEEAIHQKIQENKNRKDTKKKSGFQKRLEEMAKQRGYNPPKRK